MTLEEYIEERRKIVANMTLAQARDLIAKTLSHSDMEIEFDKAVWMLLECADEKINGATIKALEQEPFAPMIEIDLYSVIKQKYIERDVLDKIRAEIKALSPEPTAYDVVDGNPIKDAVWETLIEVDKILDKYKAESEVEE